MPRCYLKSLGSAKDRREYMGVQSYQMRTRSGKIIQRPPRKTSIILEPPLIQSGPYIKEDEYSHLFKVRSWSFMSIMTRIQFVQEGCLYNMFIDPLTTNDWHEVAMVDPKDRYFWIYHPSGWRSCCETEKLSDFLGKDINFTGTSSRISPSNVLLELKSNNIIHQNIGKEVTKRLCKMGQQGKNSLKCFTCRKTFQSFLTFRMHIDNHAVQIKPKYKCEFCNKSFVRSWLLKGHMRTHTGERPYKCTFPDCQKAFADKSNLRSHILIHTVKERTHVCKDCNKSFTHKRYLHKHKKEFCVVLKQKKNQ